MVRLLARSRIPLVVALNFFGGAVFFAANAALTGINIDSPSDINTLVICKVAEVIFWSLLSVSTIMVLYGGFLYLTARDNAEKVSKAHKTLIYAAVGIIVALAAGAIPKVIASIFNVNGIDVCQ